MREALGRPLVTGKDQFMFGNSRSHKRFFYLGARTKNEISQTNFVRIQVFDWGIREGINKSQEWADIASRKKAIA